MTNYERIKNMSIEEMAEMLDFCKCKDFCIYAKTDDCIEKNGAIRNCEIGVMKYLESEVEE